MEDIRKIIRQSKTLAGPFPTFHVNEFLIILMNYFLNGLKEQLIKGSMNLMQ